MVSGITNKKWICQEFKEIFDIYNIYISQILFLSYIYVNSIYYTSQHRKQQYIIFR